MVTITKHKHRNTFTNGRHYKTHQQLLIAYTPFLGYISFWPYQCKKINARSEHKFCEELSIPSLRLLTNLSRKQQALETTTQ